MRVKIRQVERSADRREWPLVVGGCYRSGTSLVRRILNAHPHIHCGPEVKFFRDFYGDFLDVEDPIEDLRFMVTARSILPEAEVLQVLGRAFVRIHERAARNAGKARWADKAPENMTYLRQWQELLGDRWLLLHVVRNPLDTLASIKEIGFPKDIPPKLEDRIDFYVRYAEAGLAFAQANPNRYVRVVYEELVEEPDAKVRKLMADLGERFDPVQMRFNSQPHQRGLEDRKIVATTSVHREAVGRWQRILTPTEAESIVRATAGIWSQLGAAIYPLPNAEEARRLVDCGREPSAP